MRDGRLMPRREIEHRECVGFGTALAGSYSVIKARCSTDQEICDMSLWLLPCKRTREEACMTYEVAAALA